MSADIFLLTLLLLLVLVTASTSWLLFVKIPRIQKDLDAKPELSEAYVEIAVSRCLKGILEKGESGVHYQLATGLIDRLSYEVRKDLASRALEPKHLQKIVTEINKLQLKNK